jgi:hypothetical protein
MTSTGVAASWLAECSGRDLSPSLGWEVYAVSLCGYGTSAEESANFLVPRAGRMLVEDFLGAAALLEGAADLGPFVAAATVDLVAFCAGAAGAWVSKSMVEISSVMSRVR